MFPHCRFGDKCLYIHPICKYDSVCSRKDCPFFHTFTANIKRNQLMNPIITNNNCNNNVICKYFPKCTNPNCEFIHPKVKIIIVLMYCISNNFLSISLTNEQIVCHYGSTCKTFNCPYIHPQQNPIPHPSQLKWSSVNDHQNINLNINHHKQRKQID